MSDSRKPPHSVRVLSTWVDAYELEPFGLSTPSALPCLSLRYHIAQKIHGMTQPSAEEDASNERFRDLADVLLLRDLAGDLPAVRAACVEVFAFRGTHGWPPALDPPAFWEELYTELASGLELEEKTLEEAERIVVSPHRGHLRGSTSRIRLTKFAQRRFASRTASASGSSFVLILIHDPSLRYQISRGTCSYCPAPLASGGEKGMS